jgi:hypothetical protein
MTQAAVRAASVQLLRDYAADAAVKLQVYPGRPATLYAPSAFVDRITEVIAYVGPDLMQRTPQAHVVVLHGLFDTAEAAAQKDAFVDGFIAWLAVRPHSAGANTLLAVVATEDIPGYTPDWVPPERQTTYYATDITLEGWAEN